MAKHYYIKKYDKVISDYNDYETAIYHALLLNAEIIEFDE